MATYVTFQREIEINGERVFGLRVDDLEIKEGVAVKFTCGGTTVIIPWHNIEAVQDDGEELCDLCGATTHLVCRVGQWNACPGCAAAEHKRQEINKVCDVCEEASATETINFRGEELDVCVICAENVPTLGPVCERCGSEVGPYLSIPHVSGGQETICGRCVGERAAAAREQ